MRLEGINAAVPAMKDTAGVPAVQRQIQALQRNLSRLENKRETTEAEEEEKRRLEKQLSELKRQLREIEAEQNRKRQSHQEEEKAAPGARPKEENKGENVDIII